MINCTRIKQFPPHKDIIKIERGRFNLTIDRVINWEELPLSGEFTTEKILQKWTKLSKGSGDTEPKSNLIHGTYTEMRFLFVGVKINET